MDAQFSRNTGNTCIYSIAGITGISIFTGITGILHTQ